MPCEENDIIFLLLEIAVFTLWPVLAVKGLLYFKDTGGFMVENGLLSGRRKLEEDLESSSFFFE